MQKAILVTDDPARFDQARANLEARGYQVNTAADGVAAIQSIEQDKPDLIILDSILATDEIFGLCRRIREFSRVPILMVGPAAWGEMGEPSNKPCLSPREEEILHRLCDGGSNREIARELFISESTVKSHLRRIFKKLGVHDRTQAVALALQGPDHVRPRELQPSS
jgi:DNA-binding NarL/FixJ family response regulator